MTLRTGERPANIAQTMFKAMVIPIPQEMTEKRLLGMQS